MMKQNPSSELLLPAGSFQAACAAFDHGADAVYLGLKQFSARARAENFTLEQIRRLRTLADRKGGKIFGAFNTVIKQNELKGALEAIVRAYWAGIDAVIIQDYGLIEPLKSLVPQLPLHASTQMAVHNAEGARWLADQGFSRVILSRELTLEEISLIREELPELELEVFIHGALCYGFSGLCLASGSLLGRSGNRGQCAQICRTWFTQNDRPGYFFSSKDMMLGGRVRELVERGITSLKIEGRMKGPDYTSSAAAYYRAVLENRETPELRKRLQTAFSRKTGPAFWDHPGVNTDPEYAGHRGIPAGKVVQAGKARFRFEACEDIHLRDGLFFLRDQGRKLPRPVNFAVRNIEVNSQPVPVLRAGQSGFLEGLREAPPVGTEMGLISRHDDHLKQTKEGSLSPSPFPLTLKISSSGDGLQFSTGILGQSISLEVKPLPEEAKNPVDITERWMKPWKSAGDFTISIMVTDNLPYDGNLFLAPSKLKTIRREFFEKLENRLPTLIEKQIQKALSSALQLPVNERPFSGEPPSRASMTPGPVPFAFPDEIPDLKIVWVPLPPVLFDAKTEIKRWVDQINSHQEIEWIFGLGNPGHMALAEKTAAFSNVSFFLDYGFYIANPSAAAFFLKRLPKLRFFYPWIEGTESFRKRLSENLPESMQSFLQLPGEDFAPPLFISRSEPALPEGPLKENAPVEIIQQERRFTVVMKGELTYFLPSFEQI